MQYRQAWYNIVYYSVTKNFKAQYNLMWYNIYKAMQLKQINWLWHRSGSPSLGVLTRAEIDEQVLSYIQSGMAKSEISPEDV